MDVGVYVTELLQKLDEVSLSGIGTFYKKRTSAYFDNKQGIFFPPSQEYAFDSEKAASISSLVQYICEVRNISEPSARYFIDKYVDSIKQSLQIKGYAVIDTIGKLRTANSSYVFEPTPIEDNAANYGLTPVVDIERKANKNQEPDFSAIRLKAQPQPEMVAAPEKKEKEEKSYRSAILIVITFLALGAAIVAGYFMFPHVFRPQDKTKQQNPPKSSAPAATSSEAKNADSLSTKSGDDALKAKEAEGDSIFEKSLQQLALEKGITVEKARDTMNMVISSKPATGKKDTVASAPVSSITKYEIITAAFHRESEAETYIAQLRKKGIDASIVVDSKKPKYKISMGSFTNEEAAHKERRRIQEKIAKDAWVLTLKNN